MLRRTLLSALFLTSVWGCSSSNSDTTSTTTASAAGIYKVTLTAGGISATVVAQSGFAAPRDSVPTSDGSVFYFVAATPDGKPGVFRVSAAGGSPASLLVSGAPLVAPLGIAISGDDKTIFVADPAAGLFRIPAAGGSPTLIAGTDCMKPRGLDVAVQGGAEQIFFSTGPGACGGGAGLAKVATSGGAASFVASGAPFATPTGVVVGKNGDVYLSNPASEAAGPGNVIVVKGAGSAASELVAGLSLGYPAGVALDVANATLFVSGRDATGHDQVYGVRLADKTVATFNTGISANTIAGGLHRAAGADVFSWCGAR